MIYPANYARVDFMEKPLSPKRLPARLQAHPIFVMIMLLKAIRRMSTERYGEKTKGVNVQHYAILAMIDEYGTLSQKQISQMIDVDPSDVVGLMDTLEKAQTITRTRNPNDRRRLSLQITDAGRRELANLDVRTTAVNDIFFQSLSSGERRQFEQYLRRLLEDNVR